jgi:hypothetical protein
MASSAAVEPRMACPACGGQVHPIAGRCKHCKADLNRLRASGGAAARAPLAKPALVALGGGNGNGHGHGATNGAGTHAAPVAVAPLIATTAPDGADAIAAPRSGWSSKWPLVVAFIAVVAIIASVALLLFGGDHKKRDRGVHRTDGPAPELTPTDPLAPHATPSAPMPPSGGAAPAIPAPSNPDPGPGALAPTPPPSTRGGRGPQTASDFFATAVDVACRRMTTCSSDPQIAQYCTQARTMLPQVGSMMNDMCKDYDASAAGGCLDAVSRFPCPSGGMDPTEMSNTLMGLSDCQKVCPSAFAGLGDLGDLGMPSN